LTEGRTGAVTIKGVAATTMVAVIDADWAGLLLSVTIAAKLVAPLTVGVPEIKPD
jgi:hypothetical protein